MRHQLAGPGRDPVQVFQTFRQDAGDDQPVPEMVQFLGRRHLIEQGMAGWLGAGGEVSQDPGAAGGAQPPEC
jgi:hypothetical protein